MVTDMAMREERIKGSLLQESFFVVLLFFFFVAHPTNKPSLKASPKAKSEIQ